MPCKDKTKTDLIEMEWLYCSRKPFLAIKLKPEKPQVHNKMDESFGIPLAKWERKLLTDRCWQLAALNIWLKLWNPVVPYAVYSAVQLRERFIHANRWRRFEKWGAYTTFTFYLSYSFVFLFYSFPIVKGKNNELKFNDCPFQSKSKFDCVLICLQ